VTGSQGNGSTVGAKTLSRKIGEKIGGKIDERKGWHIEGRPKTAPPMPPENTIMSGSGEGDVIAFVSPRFGDGVIGGAEAVLADAAFGLARRGYNVEILTTCARDHFTWSNEFPPGRTVVDDVSVVRFPTVIGDGAERKRIGDNILAGKKVSIQDQQLWVNDSLRCPEMWHHVFDNGDRYRALIFAPYMFWTTYAVAQIHPSKSIIMPCLHDEAPARLDIFREVLQAARGLWFLTEPERELGQRMYDPVNHQATVGASVAVPDRYEPTAFLEKYKLDRPFIYYAGRREWGKGWDSLLSGFNRFISERGRPLALVTSGVGAIDHPLQLTADVIDVGLLSDKDRNDAMAAAAAYVQPSAMESFSRTVLEAMLAGTPVIANGASDVVRWHVQKSKSGLLYNNDAELLECLHFAADYPGEFKHAAVEGRRYVLNNFQLNDVLDRMEKALDHWLPISQAAGAAGARHDTVGVTAAGASA